MHRLAVFLSVLLLATPPSGVAQPMAADYLARAEASMQSIAAAAPGAPARAACAAHMEAAFDLAALAEAVAGPRVLTVLGTAGRPTFDAALHLRLAADCARERRPGRLVPLGERPVAGGIALAARLVPTEGAERVLVWRLRHGGPWGWQASDLSIDGRGIAATLHAEVQAQFEQMGGTAEAAVSALARGARLP